MGFLKYIDRPFYWCQKIAKKWWLSWSYLELEEAKIPRETATTTATMMATTTTAMATATTTTLKTKVHSQGFVMIPKNCQKVMVITVICHLKSCLNFVRAPCKSRNFCSIWRCPVSDIYMVMLCSILQCSFLWIPTFHRLNWMCQKVWLYCNKLSTVTYFADSI